MKFSKGLGWVGGRGLWLIAAQQLDKMPIIFAKKRAAFFLQKACLKNLSHCNTLPFSEPAMMRHPLAMDTDDSDTETSEDEDFTRVIMIIQR